MKKHTETYLKLTFTENIIDTKLTFIKKKKKKNQILECKNFIEKIFLEKL